MNQTKELSQLEKVRAIRGDQFKGSRGAMPSLRTEKGTLDRARLAVFGIATLAAVKDHAIGGTVAISGLGMKAELGREQLQNLPSYDPADVAEVVAAENPAASIRGEAVAITGLKHDRTGTGQAVADFTDAVIGLDDLQAERIRLAALTGLTGPKLTNWIDQQAAQLARQQAAAQHDPNGEPTDTNPPAQGDDTTTGTGGTDQQ